MDERDQQQPLFTSDIYDALSDIVRALGGPKKVATQLRPDRPADEAAKWIKDCLNRERRERFDPEQLIWLLARGREVACHGALHFICERAGYEKPGPLNPEDERAKLQRQVIEAVAVVKNCTDRLEQMSRVPLQAINGGRS